MNDSKTETPQANETKHEHSYQPFPNQEPTTGNRIAFWCPCGEIKTTTVR